MLLKNLTLKNELSLLFIEGQSQSRIKPPYLQTKIIPHSMVQNSRAQQLFLLLMAQERDKILKIYYSSKRINALRKEVLN